MLCALGTLSKLSDATGLGALPVASGWCEPEPGPGLAAIVRVSASASTSVLPPASAPGCGRSTDVERSPTEAVKLPENPLAASDHWSAGLPTSDSSQSASEVADDTSPASAANRSSATPISP